MSAVPVPVPSSPIHRPHDADFCRWSGEQADHLEQGRSEQGRFDEPDLANLIDEVRASGSSEKRAIHNRLGVPLEQLIKRQVQPGRRSPSWLATLRDQRDELSDVLADDPSLRRCPAEVLAGAYRSARLHAAQETGIDFLLFPAAPPFDVERILDPDFLSRCSADQTF